MSCDCAQCRQHYKTLGIAYGIPSESEIQDAYHESAKQWHPDLFENYASLRADAEEHFKHIQIAYRELKEHNTVAAEISAETVDAPPPNVVIQHAEEAPPNSFSDAPGFLTARHFTPQIEEMITPHMGKLGLAQAIVDLSGKRSGEGNFSQFLLLAARGMMQRDLRNNISLIWYADMGEVKFIDRRSEAKPSAWHKFVEGMAGSQAKTELQIYRRNGALFCAISGQADDSVKTAIYDFLMLQKQEVHP